jgi:hypothetical protein
VHRPAPAPPVRAAHPTGEPGDRGSIATAPTDRTGGGVTPGSGAAAIATQPRPTTGRDYHSGGRRPGVVLTARAACRTSDRATSGSGRSVHAAGRSAVPTAGRANPRGLRAIATSPTPAARRRRGALRQGSSLTVRDVYRTTASTESLYGRTLRRRLHVDLLATVIDSLDRLVQAWDGPVVVYLTPTLRAQDVQLEDERSDFRTRAKDRLLRSRQCICRDGVGRCEQRQVARRRAARCVRADRRRQTPDEEDVACDAGIDGCGSILGVANRAAARSADGGPWDSLADACGACSISSSTRDPESVSSSTNAPISRRSAGSWSVKTAVARCSAASMIRRTRSAEVRSCWTAGHLPAPLARCLAERGRRPGSGQAWRRPTRIRITADGGTMPAPGKAAAAHAVQWSPAGRQDDGDLPRGA